VERRLKLSYYCLITIPVGFGDQIGHFGIYRNRCVIKPEIMSQIIWSWDKRTEKDSQMHTTLRNNAKALAHSKPYFQNQRD